MAKQRKHYTAEEKVSILRRHLLEDVPVSKLCDERSLQPTVYFRISVLELRLEHGTPSLLLNATTLPRKAGHDGIEGFPWPVLVVR